MSQSRRHPSAEVQGHRRLQEQNDNLSHAILDLQDKIDQAIGNVERIFETLQRDQDPS